MHSMNEIEAGSIFGWQSTPSIGKRHWDSDPSKFTQQRYLCFGPRVASALACYRSRSGPPGPKCARSVPENGGCPRECSRECPTGSPRCRESVGVLDTLGLLWDTLWDTLHFRGHSRDTLGPEGPRESQTPVAGLSVRNLRASAEPRHGKDRLSGCRDK